MPAIEPVIINIVDDAEDIDLESHIAPPLPFLAEAAWSWSGPFQRESNYAGPLECIGGAGIPPEGSAGALMITIESHHTFGDGRHPTTRLCAKFLLERLAVVDPARRGGIALLDAGTGTGVLSIIAAVLGVGSIDAVDLYGHAVQCAARNVSLNGCGGIRLHQSDIGAFEPGRQYDIVVANLVTDVIIANIGKLIGLTAPGGVIIASGVSSASDERARACFREQGLNIDEFAEMDGWCGYALTAPDAWYTKYSIDQ